MPIKIEPKFKSIIPESSRPSILIIFINEGVEFYFNGQSDGETSQLQRWVQENFKNNGGQGLPLNQGPIPPGPAICRIGGGDE